MQRIGVGIIGANLAGSWGVSAHLPAIAASDRFRAVAVATTHQASADATAQQFGIPHAFADSEALIAHPDVEVVSICVRVPHHRALVAAALAAGKHIYCEWPLAIDLDEAQPLAAAAAKAPGVAMIGLQARSIPALAHARRLIAEGAIGPVIGASLHHSGIWPTALPEAMSYLQDRRTGATFLTICGGHALDAFTSLVGDFDRMSAVIGTHFKTVQLVETGQSMERTSPDQIAIAGTLTNGALATARFHGGTAGGSGFTIEINGETGNLILSAPPGTFGFQMGDLALHRTRPEGGPLEPIAVPADLSLIGAATPDGPPMAVGQMYAHLAQTIDKGAPLIAGFDDAVRLHRLIARIEDERSTPPGVLT